MKAAVIRQYGPAETIRIQTLPRPEPAPAELLIRVHAAAVTTADWRLRAAAFPGGLALAGRLVAGVLRPRAPVPGLAMSGEIAALGQGVRGYEVGQRVFGVPGRGAHAQYLTMPADGALATLPEGLSHAEAAALPFGGLTALEFLRDIAALREGQRVLIVGASGDVGASATQIASALGAEVTAMAGPGREALLRGLGASHVLDYSVDRPAGAYDLVFDTVGALDWAAARRLLLRGGLFLPLNFGLRELAQLPLAAIGSRRMRLHVSGDSRAGLEALVTLWQRGSLRPVIDTTLALEDIVAAHRIVEARHRAGAVILTMRDDA